MNYQLLFVSSAHFFALPLATYFLDCQFFSRKTTEGKASVDEPENETPKVYQMLCVYGNGSAVYLFFSIKC